MTEPNDFNFKEPNIVEDTIGSLEVRVLEKDPDIIVLHVDGVKFFGYNRESKSGVWELYPQYDLAYGHCICTGLGYLIRESWLLTKPEVTKITVLEYSKEVIDYHKKHNPDILEKLEIIHCDANQYKGDCDCLFIDHFADDVSNLDAFRIIQTCVANIKHNVLWWWQLDKHVNLNYNRYQGLRDIFNTIPNISEEVFNEYMYRSRIGRTVTKTIEKTDY
jgi:hypothetical protein